MNKQKAWRAQAAKVNATYKAKFNEAPPPGFARSLLKRATTILATPSPLFQRLLGSRIAAQAIAKEAAESQVL